MQQDIWKILLVLTAAAGLGLLTGHLGAVLLITSLGLLGWTMYRLHLLYNWIRNPSNEPLPTNDGLFYLIQRELSRRDSLSTKRKWQLSKHLAQFRKAASAIPDAIVLINDIGKIEWANLNAKSLLGISWPRDVNVKFTDLVRDPNCQRLLDNLDANPNGVEISHPKQRELTLQLTCAQYTDTLRMVMVRDISHLVKISKMQTDFVANVSHELKTPLTVLKGYLEILADHPDLGGSLQPPIEQMSAQAERMHLIVEDLLYLAKLEDRSNVGSPGEVDVTQMINTIIESIQPVIEHKRHKVQLDVRHDLRLLGNSNELRSAFANLISNAVKYTETGGVVTITWRAEGDGAELVVKDNGIGIPASALPNLTRRFYRVDDDRSRESGGTGLGLAIVKHVLQRHNADLEINSLIGVGSEFRCRFPAQHLVYSDQRETDTA